MLIGSGDGGHFERVMQECGNDSIHNLQKGVTVIARDIQGKTRHSIQDTLLPGICVGTKVGYHECC